MNRERRQTRVCVATLLLAAMPAVAAAQQPAATTSSATVVVPPAVEARARIRFGADYQLGNWLIVESENEVALAELVGPRLHDAEVRQFAQQVADDHRRLLERLRPFGDLEDERQAVTAAVQTPAASPPEATIDVTTSSRAAPVVKVPAQPVAPANLAGDGRTGAVVIAKADGPGFDLVSLRRELGKQQFAAISAALGRHSEQAFDAVYLRHEVEAHRQALATLAVFREKGSEALRSVIDDAAPIIQGHLARAEQLMAK